MRPDVDTSVMERLPEALRHTWVWWVSASALATFVLIWWKIFARTGHPGLYGILMLVPVVNVVLLLVLAFSPWPIERELRARRKGRI